MRSPLNWKDSVSKVGQNGIQLSGRESCVPNFRNNSYWETRGAVVEKPIHIYVLRNQRSWSDTAVSLVPQSLVTPPSIQDGCCRHRGSPPRAWRLTCSFSFLATLFVLIRVKDLWKTSPSWHGFPQAVPWTAVVAFLGLILISIVVILLSRQCAPAPLPLLQAATGVLLNQAFRVLWACLAPHLHQAWTSLRLLHPQNSCCRGSGF